MYSKLLSEEAQNFILPIGDSTRYNAFAKFLYAAIFDFGLVGPGLYGVLFGSLVGYSYCRRDTVGSVIYTVITFFIYFNAFTFFITGEWLFALILAPIAFRRLLIDNRRLAQSCANSP